MHEFEKKLTNERQPEEEKNESIGSKLLVEAIKSEKFSALVSRVADITFETDHEAGFALIHDRRLKRLVWGKAVGAEETAQEWDMMAEIPNSMRNLTQNSLEKAGIRDYEFRHIMNNVYEFLTLHIHQGNDLLAPSSADMQTLIRSRWDNSHYAETEDNDLNENEKYKLKNKYLIEEYPIMAIGSIPQRNNLEMLLVREKFGNKKRDPRIGEFIFDKLSIELERGRMNNEEIVEKLNSLGVFKAILLKFEKKEKYLEPIGSDLEVQIRKFCDNQ